MQGYNTSVWETEAEGSQGPSESWGYIKQTKAQQIYFPGVYSVSAAKAIFIFVLPTVMP